jgi:hypothetical protein
MAIEEVVSASVNLINQVSYIAGWMQALGFIVVLWIIFQFIALLINQKRLREIDAIRKDVTRIEGKIDLILNKHKK